MSLDLMKSKFKALSIHLLVSGVILAVVMSLILFWWYPGIWFSIDGGWQGTRIMILVDMVLGPFLTLIIFNPTKTRRHILFDFTCIGLIQVAALAWGINAVHSQRPLAIVFWDGTVYSVDEYELTQHEKTNSDLNAISTTRPLVTAALAPQNADEAAGHSASIIMGGPKMYADIERFQPLKDHRQDMESSSLNIGKIAERDDLIKAKLDSFLSKYPDKSTDDFLFLNFKGRFGEYLVILDADNNIIGYLPAEAKAETPD